MPKMTKATARKRLKEAGSKVSRIYTGTFGDLTVGQSRKLIEIMNKLRDLENSLK